MGVEKHEVEASEKDNLATSFENGANNNDGADAAAAVEVKRELTVSSFDLDNYRGRFIAWFILRAPKQP